VGGKKTTRSANSGAIRSRRTLIGVGNLRCGDDTTLVNEGMAPIWPTKPETASRVRGRIEVILDAAKTQGPGLLPAQRENKPWKGHLANLLQGEEEGCAASDTIL